MPTPVVPLVEELIPAPDPWDVARKLAHLPHLLFFDSAERHPTRGRYSFVTADATVWGSDALNGFIPSAPFDDALMTAELFLVMAAKLEPLGYGSVRSFLRGTGGRRGWYS